MFKENLKYKVLTPSGYQDFKGVQRLRKSGYRFECDNGLYCEVSKGHRFVVDGVELYSDILKVGDKLQYQSKLTNIVNIIPKEESSVYDLVGVSGGSLYYADNFLHHNCQFLGSSNTIIDGKTLVRLQSCITHPEFVDMNDKFLIWEKPVDGATYVLGVDVSKGVGSDFSVIQIFRIFGIKPVSLVQVGVWVDNFTDVYTFAGVVNRMSYYYNNAYIMCENNGEGSVVVNRLWWDFENENLINTGTKNKDLGIRATGNTKPQAVLLMKKLIEDGSIVLKDKRTIDQISDFQDLGGGKYACVNCNDDCVSALYWAVYILEQQVFDEAYEFSDLNQDEDGWGILGDWADGNENDFAWMNKYSMS